MTRKEARKLFDENFNFKGVFLSYQQDEELHETIRNALDEEYWHTGKPTEEGNYILLVDSEIKYVLAEWDGDAFDIDSAYHDEPIIAWHKISDYEEQK